MNNFEEKTDEVSEALEYQVQQIAQLRKNVSEWVSILGAIGTVAGSPFGQPGMILGGSVGSGIGLGVGVIETAVTTDWSRMPSLEPDRQSLQYANIIGTPIPTGITGYNTHESQEVPYRITLPMPSYEDVGVGVSNFMNGSRNYDFGTETGFVFDWLKEEFQDVDKEYEKNCHNMISNTQGLFTSIETQAVASLRGVFSGEINSLDDLWETTLNGMEGLWDATLTNLQQSLVNWMSQSLVDLGKWGLKEIAGSIFGDSSGPVIDELKGFLGLSGKSNGGSQVLDLAGKGATLSGMVSKAASWLGLTQTTSTSSYFGGANLAYTSGYEAAEGALAGYEAADTATTGLMAGGALGPAAMFGYAAAPIVIGNLFGDEIGSGLNAIFGSNFGESMSPEEAKEIISENFGFMGEQVDLLTGKAELMGEMFGGYLTESMQEAAFQIDQIADVAGYSIGQIDAMTDALGGQGSVVVEAASLAKNLSLQLEDLIWNFKIADEEGSALGGGFHELTVLLNDMIAGMGLGAEQTGALRDAAFGLAEQLYLGEMSVEQITASLQENFTGALEQAIASGNATAESMRSVSQAIKSIPTYWNTLVETTYTSEGGSAGIVRHQGGLLMHGGGFLAGLPRLHTGSMVSALAHDEVPVIARRGEYVVRAESVNAATLPLLQALNQTGQARAQSSPPQVNLHVEVHGNILGGAENMEELARIMERKLRDLSQTRYAA